MVSVGLRKSFIPMDYKNIFRFKEEKGEGVSLKSDLHFKTNIVKHENRTYGSS